MHTWRFLGGRLVITVLDAWKWMRVDPRIFYSPVLALRFSETATLRVLEVSFLTLRRQAVWPRHGSTTLTRSAPQWPVLIVPSEHSVGHFCNNRHHAPLRHASTSERTKNSPLWARPISHWQMETCDSETCETANYRSSPRIDCHRGVVVFGGAYEDCILRHLFDPRLRSHLFVHYRH
jgi:hypothetical protein